MIADTTGDSFGVYVHWPFCAQKCPYCDFNSHVRHGRWDEAGYLSALLRELAYTAGETSARKVASIFIGGGTPSLMQPATVAAILERIGKHWSIAPGAEITLEANPSSVEAGRFSGYRTAGVNRVSLGVQSLRDADLKALGRLHSAAEARAALEIAHRTFNRVSFDLIYARPGQRVADWEAELAEALALAGRHLSLYQLTIEPETPFAALHKAGKLIVPDADQARILFDLTQDMTSAAGLPAYEISNHAAPGEESRHNLLYWRYGAYAGVGPGAHGRLAAGRGRIATATLRQPETWAARAIDAGHGYAEFESLDPGEIADEILLMGLRLAEGFDLARLAEATGLRPTTAAITELAGYGLLEDVPRPAIDDPSGDFDSIRACMGPGLPPASHASRRLRATREGRFVLNEIVLRLSQSMAPHTAPRRTLALRP